MEWPHDADRRQHRPPKSHLAARSPQVIGGFAGAEFLLRSQQEIVLGGSRPPAARRLT